MTQTQQTQGEQSGAAAPRGSYVSGTSDTPLLGMTIGAAFDQTVARFPDREALVSRHQGLRYTWAQLRDEVDRAARGLLAIGITKGDRVGIWSPNRAEWTITQFATSKIGAILVNINPAYRLHELEYALNQSGCVALVFAPNFRATDYTAMMQTLCPELAHSAPGHLDAHKFPMLRHVIRLGDERMPGMWVWGELLERAQEVSAETLAARQAEQEFDDPINIQYTSGTTGNPKGATLSHHNILNNGYFVTDLQGFTENDRLCIPVPLYHCFGMVMGNLGCMTHGATMVYPAETFEPQAVLQTVQDERCTALYGVPTMFIAELAQPDFAQYDLSSAAYRRHGWLALPRAGDARGDRPHAHERGRDCLWHDRDQPRLLPDASGRPAGEARRDRGADSPVRRGEDHRSSDRKSRPGGRIRRTADTRLLGDAGLLGQRGGHRQRHRQPPAGCIPATWPRWTTTAMSISSGG